MGRFFLILCSLYTAYPCYHYATHPAAHHLLPLPLCSPFFALFVRTTGHCLHHTLYSFGIWLWLLMQFTSYLFFQSCRQAFHVKSFQRTHRPKRYRGVYCSFPAANLLWYRCYSFDPMSCCLQAKQVVWQEKVDMHAKLELKILASAHAFASVEGQLKVRIAIPYTFT